MECLQVYSCNILICDSSNISDTLIEYNSIHLVARYICLISKLLNSATRFTFYMNASCMLLGAQPDPLSRDAKLELGDEALKAHGL